MGQLLHFVYMLQAETKLICNILAPFKYKIAWGDPIPPLKRVESAYNSLLVSDLSLLYM